MLELRIALLARLLLLAVLVEARNRGPGSIRRRLPSLGIEADGKRVRAGKDCTIALQVILADAALIHPLAQARIANELRDADRLINGRILFRRASQFILVDQHSFTISLSLLAFDLFPKSPHDQVLKGPTLLLGALPDCRLYHADSAFQAGWFVCVLRDTVLAHREYHVNDSPPPSPPSKAGPFIPGLKVRGFLGRFR